MPQTIQSQTMPDDHTKSDTKGRQLVTDGRGDELQTETEDEQTAESPDQNARTETDPDGAADQEITQEAGKSQSKRLYIIEYGSENERKRAEYTLKNWEGAAVERPSGTIRIVEAENQEGLMNKLISTIPYDHIRAYDLTDIEISENIEEVTLTRTLSASREGIETTLEFMMSQRSGEIIDINKNETTYEVEDRGPAEVTYTFIDTSDPDKTEIEMTIKGAPQTTQHLYNSFRDELDQFEQNRSSR